MGAVLRPQYWPPRPKLVRYLHTGEAGGIAGETIAAIASVGAALLVWIGIWLACRRCARWMRGRVSSPARMPVEVPVER